MLALLTFLELLIVVLKIKFENHLDSFFFLNPQI
jgi:hypothetical protein